MTDEKLQDSKVLVLTFDNGKGKNIYESSQYILKKKSDLLDHSLECVKLQDEAFLNEQNAFWNDEVLSSSRKEV